MIKPLILNDIAEKIRKSGKDIYVYGVNQDAKAIFVFLLNEKIFVKGFVDENYAGCRLYNKKIYSVKEIVNSHAILIGNNSVDVVGVETYKSIYEADDRIKNKKIVLYGAGYIGKKVLQLLRDCDIEVTCFIDADQNKWGQSIDGVKICSKSILEDMDEGYTLVICGKFWKEIWDEIEGEIATKKIDCFYMDEIKEEARGYLLKDGDMFLPEYAFLLQEYYPEKEVILYGRSTERAKEFLYLLRYFEIKNISIINEEMSQKEFYIEGISNYTHLEDVLFRDSYIVYLFENDVYKELQRVHELGLELAEQFCKWNMPLAYIKDYSFDVNLGWTQSYCSEDAGVNVYKGASEQKIVVLGGSTSADEMYPFKSWPQLLYEKLGKQVTVYNCAIDGYTTAQELIKLIRDAVELKPDLVITYDGYNDVGGGDKIDKKFWIMNTYIKKIYHNVSLNTLDDVRSPREQVIWEGISTHTDQVMDYYEKNLEYMNAVCQINRIKYMSFIQPTFWGTLQGKTSLTKHEKEMSLVCNWEHLTKGCYALRKEAKEIDAKHDYIIDFSAIFDEEDVFMDWCHVYEKGNEIIADKIYEAIKEKGII